MYNLYRYACRAGVQFVQEHAGKSSDRICESFHGHPDEVGLDEFVIIDPAAVTLSRGESQVTLNG